MLSLPDIKEKQILFLQTDWETKPCIKFANENLVFTKDKKIINQASCHKILAVFIQGDLSITTKLIKELDRFGISLFFLKYNFECFAQINSKADGNYLLRQNQYQLSDNEELEIAKKLMKNKTLNQLFLLKKIKKIKNFEEFKVQLFGEIEKAKDSNSLLGVEGNLASNFYSQYFKEIDWLRRTPRAKIDIPNLLMDIGYTYLFNFIDALLGLFGFDSYKGVYHKLFFQRKSLSCDIMEPFRCIIDKQILKSYNLKQIDDKDFEEKNGEMILPWKNSKKYTQLFLTAIMDNKEEIFKFVQNYYRFINNPEKYKFPVFKIK